MGTYAETYLFILETLNIVVSQSECQEQLFVFYSADLITKFY